MKSLVSTVVMILAVLGVVCAPEAKDPKPEVVRFGASVAEIERLLQGRCAQGFRTRRIEPPFLPAVEGQQVQVDCDGFSFLGVPRWTEFVIGDDRLQMVWIMVEPEEEAAVIAVLTEAYGEPSHRNGDYVAFAPHRAAWRFRPAEVLFYAAELDEWILPWFEAD